LIRASRGYVILRSNPLRFERVDNVLATDGSVRRFVRNRLLVSIEPGKESLVVTPLGPDAGRAPLVTALKIEVPKSEADLSIDGINYVCHAPSDNLTGLSYAEP
jgi:hypothetical protein